MQDLQAYQYYDPSPAPPPVSWWRQPKFWKRIGLGVGGAVVLVLVIIFLINVVKNKQLVKSNQERMDAAMALSNQLKAVCAKDDLSCLALAQADAARQMGLAAACNGLADADKANCVMLIAIDNADPEVCDSLDASQRQPCLDHAYLLLANEQIKAQVCNKIVDGPTQAACLVQVTQKAVKLKSCASAGVDESLCDASDQLGLAISNGTEAGCLALSDEISQQDCLFTIQAQKKDTDRDGLTDGEEINIYKTNPLISDTDGDGFADGLEVDSGYDPLK